MSAGGRRLADEMPSIAAWVSDLRSAFGNELLDHAIIRSRQGESTFYASENGHTFGTKAAESSLTWTGEGLSDRRYCPGCDGSCVGTQIRCSSRNGSVSI
jgi:hypothetical protein